MGIFSRILSELGLRRIGSHPFEGMISHYSGLDPVRSWDMISLVEVHELPPVRMESFVSGFNHLVVHH